MWVTDAKVLPEGKRRKLEADLFAWHTTRGYLREVENPLKNQTTFTFAIPKSCLSVPCQLASICRTRSLPRKTQKNTNISKNEPQEAPSPARLSLYERSRGLMIVGFEPNLLELGGQKILASMLQHDYVCIFLYTCLCDVPLCVYAFPFACGTSAPETFLVCLYTYVCDVSVCTRVYMCLWKIVIVVTHATCMTIRPADEAPPSMLLNKSLDPNGLFLFHYLAPATLEEAN